MKQRNNLILISGLATVALFAALGVLYQANAQPVPPRVVADDVQCDNPCINSFELEDGQVATADIADNAITNAKLDDNSVTANEIATDAVTSSEILDGTIVNVDVSTSAAIEASKVDFTVGCDGCIGTDNLADGAVTKVKVPTSFVKFGSASGGVCGGQSTCTISDSAVLTTSTVLLNVVSSSGNACGQAPYVDILNNGSFRFFCGGNIPSGSTLNYVVFN